MLMTRISLPLPTALDSLPPGKSKTLPRQLSELTNHQFSELAEFASLLSPDINPRDEQDARSTKLGVNVHDLYDEYFEVDRTLENSGDALAAAFIKSLAEIGKDAKRGHNLDPLALHALLRAIQVQAKILMQEAYYA